ncbi:MAG: hypothetical protein J2P19_26080 [Pseudonocardia sp.]|nr:hypothetical protein [Pseudonocardia sp.]
MRNRGHTRDHGSRLSVASQMGVPSYRVRTPTPELCTVPSRRSVAKYGRIGAGSPR